MQKFEETKKLLQNSNIYYLIAVGMDSNYLYVNDRYSKIFESIHGNLIGRHYSTTMHKEDQEICKTTSAKAFMNPDEIFPATIRKFDGKGSYVITQWEYKALLDEQQQPVGIFCIGHDITQYMQTSTELENTKESLSKTQLTIAQMAYVQSHVIRKPIANIMGLTLLLDSFGMDPNLHQMFTMINDSAKELDQVIRDMAPEGSL
jgi:PAS domain S-box-containing protein